VEKIPSESIEGICNARGKLGMLLLGEGFNFETLKSSSLEKCSSIVEFTFMTTSSFRETEQKVGEKRVQLQNNQRVMM